MEISKNFWKFVCHLKNYFFGNVFQSGFSSFQVHPNLFYIIFHQKILNFHGKSLWKFRWKSWIFSKMKSQGYWRIFIRIMRKDGFFVKGYPFDWTNSKTKIFHNHPINLMKSGDFKICKLFKSITRTKWYISLKLW